MLSDATLAVFLPKDAAALLAHELGEAVPGTDPAPQPPVTTASASATGSKDQGQTGQDDGEMQEAEQEQEGAVKTGRQIDQKEEEEQEADGLVYGKQGSSNRSRNLSGFRRSRRPMFGQYMVLLAIQAGGVCGTSGVPNTEQCLCLKNAEEYIYATPPA
jgi:hypothetical protein